MIEVMPAPERGREDFPEAPEGARVHLPWREIVRVWLTLREKSHSRLPTSDFGPAAAFSPLRPSALRNKILREPKLDPKCDTRSFRLLSTNIRRTCGQNPGLLARIFCPFEFLLNTIRVVLASKRPHSDADIHRFTSIRIAKIGRRGYYTCYESGFTRCMYTTNVSENLPCEDRST